jgi:hypothetical protein
MGLVAEANAEDAQAGGTTSKHDDQMARCPYKHRDTHRDYPEMESVDTPQREACWGLGTTATEDQQGWS